ncbi:MAG: hypothetical protein KAQ98_06280 [Bacteriovoracaceae bacterium]|nr:hypothetical protein [Bacteriovoracaceae bacterium]
MNRFRCGTLLITIVALMLLLASCLPQSPNSGKRKTSLPLTSLDTTPAANPTFTSDDALYWYSNTRVDGTITVNQDTQNRIYVRGSNLHNFLNGTDSSGTSNFTKTYCLVVSFNQNGAANQLRTRGVPIQYTNGTSVEKLLRLDLPDRNENNALCKGDVASLDNKSANTVFTYGGKIYVGTDNGLYISSDGGATFTNASTAIGLGGNRVNSIHVTSAGHIYVATTNGLSYSTNNGESFSTYSISDGLGANTVNNVYISTAGNIFAATTNGLSIKFSTSSVFVNRTTGNNLPSNSINGVFVDASNTIHVATDGGYAISTNTSGTNFNSRTTINGLGSNIVNDVFVNGATIYAATDGGLSISTDSGNSFSNRTTSNGLGSNSVKAAMVYGSYLYAATANGLAVSINAGTSFTNKTTVNGLRSNTLYDVACDGSRVYTTSNSGFNLSSSVSADSFSSLQTTSVAYSPVEFCPTCYNVVAGTAISFYTSNNGISDTTKVPQTNINFSSLSFRIDTSSNTTTNPISCSLSTCQAKGFDCCIDGQCVHDGIEKPNASSQSNYSQALADVATNPMNFTSWPNIYFVCGGGSVPTPTPTPTPDADATANALFEQHKKEYYCLDEAKNSTPDYSNCDPNQDYASWDTIRRNVWARCGCVENMATPGPNDPEPFCPDFGLKAIKDQNNNIMAIECYIPQPTTDPTPFQELGLNLSNRSIPHRYFASSSGTDKDGNYISAGESIDSLSDLSTSTNPPEPEGTPFRYLDDSGKTDPEDGPFSMNSILGQMSLELNQAVPAKAINVEFDQTYIISARQGSNFTPCPQCVRDSWFDVFTAFPQTTDGNGLRSIGYATDRMNIENNLSYGNYEDTIFGRACWVPPTMIPLTHSKNSSAVTQRMNRLKAQAAFWVNGHQRDWYGFNKGALIGSFDGVSWFAIGTGRRATSTSNKLFLAINSPFADLADMTTTTVSIIVDIGGNNAANYDYDPNIEIDDINQNKAGTCQRWHQCQTDVDCITKLGWEYMCADTSKFKTSWPKFDINGNEVANDQIDQATFSHILHGNLPAGTTKRCVYRGAGAPCKGDYSLISDVNTRKFLTCAPNFYCSQISSASYNERAIRTPNMLLDIKLGQEADILGRPANYVNANASLTSDIKTNISNNALLYTSDTSDFGMCRPGKKIYDTGGSSVNQLNQHQSRDSLYRTDYINQIASCDSTSITSTNGNDRVISCPILDMTTKNYVIKTENFSTLDFEELHRQNSCGQESQYDSGGGNYNSVFKEIEAMPIPSLAGLTEPSIARDSCMRRAGSVCHTDLDCSPNKLHSEQASWHDYLHFGNTVAEKEYWEEYLVCGQSTDKPSTMDYWYSTFDITLNRCCRPSGEKLTMYTQYDDTTLISNEISESLTRNLNLLTGTLPKDNPRTQGRYSRYTIASPLGVVSSSPYTEVPKVEKDVTPKQYQWKTINDTGAKTCCGGGFIRNFSEGGHDWSSSFQKLSINISNFKCLNYENSLAFLDNDDPSSHNLNPINYDQDYVRLCKFPGYGDPTKNGGCVQVAIDQASDFKLKLPQEISLPSYAQGATVGSAILDTSPTQSVQVYASSSSSSIPIHHSKAPYMPVPYRINYPTNGDSSGPFYYIASRQIIFGSSFYLPLYVGRNYNINKVQLKYFDDSNNVLETVDVQRINCDGLSDPYSTNGLWGCSDLGVCQFYSASERWCSVNLAGHGDIFHIRARPSRTWGADSTPWSYAGIVIDFNYINGDSYNYNGNNSTDTTKTGVRAGNDLYYLTKLGRLELSGIPQIFYEPIFCNSDRSKIVDGIFKTTNTRSIFEALSFPYDPNMNKFSDGSEKRLHQIYDKSLAYNAGDSTTVDRSAAGRSSDAASELIAFQNQLSVPPIFSPHDFSCCQKLNTVVQDKTKCCSGHAANAETTSGQSVTICKLPSRVDLNVYFNRFVSNEGSGDDITDTARLDDEDFIPETGEPKLRQVTMDKIKSLGVLVCESGAVVKGGAFGNFPPQPNNGTFGTFTEIEPKLEAPFPYYSIVDDARDYEDPSLNDSGGDDDVPRGAGSFLAGYRWNHHWYCK